MIPYGRQQITQTDIDAVAAVLNSDFLTQGPTVPRFEQAVAACCGAKHAVAVNSATSALHLGCLALDLGPGDRLWTSPNSFVASANCARYCGAAVDFVDIDPRTYNMNVEALKQKLKVAEQKGCLPKVVVPVHFAGQPCDMERIKALSDRYGFSIIEDAAHAIGAKYKDNPVGGCHYSDIAVFSFHPVKIITTGEGGMALTNRPDLAERMARLRSHGITRDTSSMSRATHGPWYYEQIELGFNYRMTDIQAALGLSQLRRLDAFLGRRRELAARYDTLLNDLPLTLPWQHPDGWSAWHLYVVRLHLQRGGATQREIFETMRKAGIGVQLHYVPIHTQPDYQRLGFSWGDFPQAEAYYTEAKTLPLYPEMTEAEQEYVVDTLRAIIES
jgi:UDP-4-amino-4,6-dideoxy-N-acetyl-beta-L-altrosamine transaminase